MNFVVLETDMSEILATAKRVDAYCGSSKPLVRAAIIARGGIRARAARGQGFKGEFAEYSPEYAQRLGISRKPVTLRRSGKLLNNLSESYNGDGSVTLGPAPEDMKKAEGLTAGRGKLHGRAKKLARFAESQVRSGLGPDAARQRRRQNNLQAKKGRPFMSITEQDDRNIEIGIEAELQSVIDNVGN